MKAKGARASLNVGYAPRANKLLTTWPFSGAPSFARTGAASFEATRLSRGEQCEKEHELPFNLNIF